MSASEFKSKTNLNTDTPGSKEGETLFVHRSLVLLFVLQFVFGLSFSIFFLFPKFLSVEFGCSPEDIGLVMSIGGVSSILAIPFIAHFIDRVPKRRMIQLGTLITALTAISFLWVNEVGMLVFVLRAVQGVGFVLVFNGVMATVAEKVPSEKLDIAIGMIGLATLATNAISPALGEVISEVGWKYVFVFAGVTGIIASVISVFLPIENQIAHVGRDTENKTSLDDTIRMQLVFAFLASLAIGLGFGVIITFYQPFALSLGMTQVRNFFLGYTCSAIVARLALGKLRTRLSRQHLATFSLISYAFTVWMMGHLNQNLLPWLGAGLGFSHGIAYPVVNAIALSGIPKRYQGKVTSYFNGLFNLGYTLGSIGFGFLVTSLGYPGIYFIAAVLVVGIVPFQLFALKKRWIPSS